MKSKLPRQVFLPAVFLCLVWTAPALADPGEVVLESVSREHCSPFSGPSAAVPAKVVLEQTIVKDSELRFPYGIYAMSEYRGQEGVNRGRMTVRARLIKRSGFVITLPTLKAQVGDRGAYASDLTPAVFEKGDVIRWVGRLKKHPEIFSCWRLEMGIHTGESMAPLPR